jgi:tetratricopeptide (TPR) repeat protein
MSTDHGVLAVRLGVCRQAAGLSQEELAEQSGLSVRTIRNIERGRTRWPHPGSVRRLADALGLDREQRDEFIAVADRRLVSAAGAVTMMLEDGLSRAGGGPAASGKSPMPARQADGGAAGSSSFTRVVPRQLPAPVGHFVGRALELERLTALAAQAADGCPTVVISAIGGMAGVGKTALALHFAHQVAGRFPDGQLYVNLRGFDPSGRPVPPVTAIRSLLEGLEVPAGMIPAGLEAQAGLYRSLLAGRRVLIVLDNARDAAQVRPLLPGCPGCLVIVTSRNRLAGLVAAEGASPLDLDVLSDSEAGELLARRLGAGRLEADPDAAAQLLSLCAALPLALVIAAARAAAPAGFPLAALAAELRDESSNLDALETGDPASSVRAVFSWSYQGLSTQAASMFRLLGLHPGPDISAAAAASLAGVSLTQARRRLAELTRASLLDEPVPGRYALHDLLREYAAGQARAEESGTDRREATGRVLDHYLHTARAAALLLVPARESLSVAPAPPRADVTPERPDRYRQALDWFEAEHQVLLAAVTHAAQTGIDACAWQIAWALTDFLDWRGHWQEWTAVQHTALHCATRMGAKAGQAAARFALALNCDRLGNYDQARAHLAASLRLFSQLGRLAAQAHVSIALGAVASSQGDYADAVDHSEQALRLFRAIGDQGGQAIALNNIGYNHSLLGRPQPARVLGQQALGLFQLQGDRYGEAHALDSLGYAEHQLGNLPAASDCYIHALGILRELGDRYHEARTLAHLGDACHEAGRPDAAREAWHQALDILNDLHHADAEQVGAKLCRRQNCA